MTVGELKEVARRSDKRIGAARELECGGRFKECDGCIPARFGDLRLFEVEREVEAA